MNTRIWLACLAVVAALVVGVPALVGDVEPRRRGSQPAEARAVEPHSDVALVGDLERSLGLARSFSASPAAGATAPAVRERRAAPDREAYVSLESFVAEAQLRGVYFGETYRAAVLNGELVQEGDGLAPGIRVQSIGERHVVLSLGSTEARIDLPSAALAGLAPSAGSAKPGGSPKPVRPSKEDVR